jgi:CRISPR-associated endonuclease/helicase Cas3
MNFEKTRSYYQYWGKARWEESAWHLLPYHCLDVCASTWHLLEEFDSVAHRLCQQINFPFELFKPWTLFFSAIHDIGKFSYTFQNLVPDLTFQLQQKNFGHASYNKRHDYLGLLAWKSYLCEEVSELFGITNELIFNEWIQAS